MQTTYHLVLFLHVLSAMIWVGAAITLELLGWRAALSRKPVYLLEMTAIARWLGPRVFGPAAGATVLLGIILVIIGKPTFSQFWIHVAFVGIILTGIIGGVLLHKPATPLIQALSARKRNANLVNSLYRKMILLSRINLAILLIILYDMIEKPTIADTTFYIVSLIIVVVIGGFSLMQYRAGAGTTFTLKAA